MHINAVNPDVTATERMQQGFEAETETEAEIRLARRGGSRGGGQPGAVGPSAGRHHLGAQRHRRRPGLINFGLLLWLPAHLVAKGYAVALASELLAASALIALPTVGAAAFLYSRWSSKGALAGSIALTALGLLGVLWLDLAPSAAAASPVWPVALLIVGVNGLIAMLLPYAAESYPLSIRGRATGWVAACTRAAA